MRPGRTIYRWTAFGLALLLAGCMPAPSRSTGPSKAKLPDDSIAGKSHRSARLAGPARRPWPRPRRPTAAKSSARPATCSRKSPTTPRTAPRSPSGPGSIRPNACGGRRYYPKAVDAYHKLLQDFPAGPVPRAGRRPDVPDRRRVAPAGPRRDRRSGQAGTRAETEELGGRHHPRQLRPQDADLRRRGPGPADARKGLLQRPDRAVRGQGAVHARPRALPPRELQGVGPVLPAARRDLRPQPAPRRGARSWRSSPRTTAPAARNTTARTRPRRCG